MWKLTRSAVVALALTMGVSADERTVSAAVFCNSNVDGSLCADDASGPYGTIEIVDKNVYVNLSFAHVDLDALGLDSDCADGGYSYHIHKSWDNLESDFQAFGDDCGSDNTGGHWDPWFACGPASGEDECTATCIPKPADGGSYDCSEDTFDEDPLACEVGDLSGKYGKIIPDSNGWFIMSYANTWEADANDTKELSVVIHCNDGDRAFCAKFEIEEEEFEETVTEPQDSTATVVTLGDSGVIDNFAVAVSEESYVFWVPKDMYDATNMCKEWTALIHSEWTDMFKTTAMNNYCNDSVSGMVWDPTTQCHPLSANDNCETEDADANEVKRCDGDAFVYECDRYQCATGDLSRLGTIDFDMYCSEASDFVEESDGIEYCKITVMDDLPIPVGNLNKEALVLTCADEANTDYTQICAQMAVDTADAAIASFCNDQLDSDCGDDYINGPDGYILVAERNVYVNLDFSKVNFTALGLDEGCQGTGYSYHIHKSWDNLDDSTQAFAGDCGSDNTGGHWDPWFACGPASGEAECTADCIPKPADGGTYDCSTTSYASDPFNCEVGDWSGKYGKIIPDDNGLFQMQYSSTYETDAADFTGGDTLSVVIHCDGGTRAFCASFSGMSDKDFSELMDERDEEQTVITLGESGAVDNFMIAVSEKNYTFWVPRTMIDTDGMCQEWSALIHSQWLDMDSATLVNDDCDDAVSGRVWDPTTQCHPLSDNDLCETTNSETSMVSRCGETAFAYDCDDYYCALGDLSRLGTINFADYCSSDDDYETVDSVEYCFITVTDEEFPIPVDMLDYEAFVLTCEETDNEDYTQVCAQMNNALTPAPSPANSESAEDSSEDAAVSFTTQFALLLSFLLSATLF